MDRGTQKFLQRRIERPLDPDQRVRWISGENTRFQIPRRRRDPLGAEIGAARLQAVGLFTDGFPIRRSGRTRLFQRGPFSGQAGTVLFRQPVG